MFNYIYNSICTNFCIIPIIYFLLNRYELKDKYIYIFYFLVVSFIVEMIHLYVFFIKRSVIDLSNIYFFFEILFIHNHFSKYFNNKTKLISKIALVIYMILGLLVISNAINFKDIIFFGITRFMLLILILFPFINLNENNLLKEKSNLYLLVAIFQYATLTTGIYTYIDFLTNNKQYHTIYNIFHSTINLLLYGLILVSMIIAKKEMKSRKINIKF